MGIAVDRFDWFVEHVRNGTLDEAAVIEGFAPSFVRNVPAKQIVAIGAQLVDLVSSPEVRRAERGNDFQVSYGSQVATGSVEGDEPHRFVGLRFHAPSQPLTDERLTDPPWIAEGATAPLDAVKASYASNGLVGVVAGAYGDDGAAPLWRIAGGYTDVAAGAAVTLDTRMLAGSISKLFTAVATLTLVARGELDLDESANNRLESLKLASDAVTIRQLLTHTAGVSSGFSHYAEVVPPAVELLGPVASLDFEPGARREYSNGGFTVLGEVIAGVTGRAAVEVISESVLEPLEMSRSSFALSWPADVGPGYEPVDGRAVEMARVVPSVPTAGGLVTTIDDLAKFVAGWRRLLPTELAHDAMTERVGRPGGGGQGYGWIVAAEGVGHGGGTRTYSSSLLWRLADGLVSLFITNGDAPAETINASLRPPL